MENIYFQTDPNPKLAGLIRSFWQIDKGEDVTVIREKIIPDGYPELIFHYGDHYRANINGIWQHQGDSLIAGQIRNHFLLENTGKSKFFGVKFQPWALGELFKVDMSALTDKVNDIPEDIMDVITDVRKISTGPFSFTEKVAKIEDWFISFLADIELKDTKGQKAVELILENKGQIDLKKVQLDVGISERTLERYFKSKVGLSPKYFSRVIRFSHIFKLIQSDETDWLDIAFLSGFYDQSHFIKNFKEFTGEDPSQYVFFEKNIANFFLKK